MASYLNFTVLVDDENQLSLQPAFVTTTSDDVPETALSAWRGATTSLCNEVFGRTPRDPDPGFVLTVEVLDGKSGVLSRTHFPLPPLCTDGRALSLSMTSGKIPWSDEAADIRFYRGNELIHTEPVPEDTPVIKLTWDPPEPLVGRHELSWEASYRGDRALHYIVLYSHTAGRSWEALSPALDSNRFEVDFDELPGGHAMVAVLASDGINTARTETRTIIVPVKPLFAVIQTPSDGDVVQAGAPVWFQGQAFDRESERPETEQLQWFSSVQGELGTGAQAIAELVEGEHSIVLRAGSGDRQGHATITLFARTEIPEQGEPAIDTK